MTIDIDPQGNTTSGFGIDKNKTEHSIYDVLINGLDVHDSIYPTKVKNLDIIISNIQLAGAEIELVPMISRETVLELSLIHISFAF